MDYRKGALFLIAGFAVIPFMDGAAKQLSELGYAPVLVAWARFSLAALVLSPMLLRPANSSIMGARCEPADITGDVSCCGDGSIFFGYRNDANR